MENATDLFQVSISQKTAERVSPVTGSGLHAGKEINYSI